MTVPPDPRQLLLRYVLHELPADERAAVDQALITDQNAFDRLQEARYDLIDAYVADELSPPMRSQVERAFLLGREGQAAVAVAIALQHSKSTANAAGISAIPAKKNAAPSSAGVAGRLKNVRLLSGLAAGLLVTAVLVDLHHNSSRSLHTKPAMRSSDSETLAARASSSAGSQAVFRQTSVLVVALPGTVRGASAIPIHLRPGIQQVQVQWPVPSDSTAPTFNLEIASAQSSIAVLPQQGTLVSMDDIRVANFFLPTQKLPNGPMIFRLRTANASSDTPVAEISVRISR